MRKLNIGRLIIFVLLGLILGSTIGVVIGKLFPALDYSLDFGLDPIVIKLAFLQLTFGIQIKLNTGTLIGVLIFLYLYAVL